MTTPANLDDLIARMQARHASIPPDSPRRAEPKPEPAKPSAYRALYAATDGLVRDVVEIHRPEPMLGHRFPVWWQCQGCEATGYDREYPDWPCGTSEYIAEKVGVSLREADYTVEAARDLG